MIKEFIKNLIMMNMMRWNKVYKEYKQKAKKRTFNDYNEFDVKNFDVKTDGTLVDYKPEFHKNRVVSNITFW